MKEESIEQDHGRLSVMKITFLGVGESCDENYPNTCLWIESVRDGHRSSVLLDCGFTAPPLYWRQIRDPDDLDALWISHFHGDHFFGTPALLLRFWERGRRKPLVLMGPKGVERIITSSMELAYPGFFQKLNYPLHFREANSRESLVCSRMNWSFAQNIHGQESLAVRLDNGKHAVFYSGDGLFTEETISLAKGVHLAVHEAFRLEGHTPGHGSIYQCIEFGRKACVQRLALVHVQRDERRGRHEEMRWLLKEVEDFEVFLPEPGDSVVLSPFSG